MHNFTFRNSVSLIVYNYPCQNDMALLAYFEQVKI